MLRFFARTLLLACAVAGGFVALPSAAPANPDYMVSIMQDDNQLVYSTPHQRRSALDRMRGLGVEAVRATVLWKAVAPKANSRRRPRGFKAANPRAYPRQLWDNYDDLVRAARDRGIAVYFNPSGGGPRWAHATTSDKAYQRSYRPDPEEFRKFMRALGRRYSGTYRDENDGHAVIPRVSWWAIWNEPDQPGWLTPQAEQFPGVGMVAMSPHLYRDLLVAGAKGLLATGHADDLVLIGELAPLGGEKPDGLRASIRPGLFLREMFCLNRRFQPFSGRAAEVRNCDSLSDLGVLEQFPRLGFAHHPYTKKRAPGKREPGRDALTMANIGSLPRMLDKIAARTGLLPPQMPVFLTEYGYETNPPDPFSGVSPDLQAEYINTGDYIAWKNPRIFSNAQFQLFDVPPRTDFPRDTRPYWFTYQSGLFGARESGSQAKPSATAYKFPLVVRRKGGTARIWGQARFAPNGASYPILIQEQTPGSNRWTRAGDVLRVDSNQGFFQTERPTARGTKWRAVWAEPDFSRFEVSRVAVAR
jgi:hypothetical protein